MSKKMWNKIFKSKTNKNSKTLQAANKINKRGSIYEEYQQLNAALDIKPLKEKADTTLQIAETFGDNDKNAATKIPQTTTATTTTTATANAFSRVVNTFSLKRSQNSQSQKDLKINGNANNGEEMKNEMKNAKNSESNNKTIMKTKSSTSLTSYASASSASVSISTPVVTATLAKDRAIAINQSHNSNCMNNNCNSEHEEDCSNSSSNSSCDSSGCSFSNSKLNTPYNASLNQQQLTATATTAITNNNNNNNNNNNEYLACKQQIFTNINSNIQQQQQQQIIPKASALSPTPPQSPKQQQKRLSKIVIVVRKFNAPLTAAASSASSSSANVASQLLETSANKSTLYHTIDPPNNSFTNNHSNNNNSNINCNNNHSFSNNSSSLAKASTTTPPPPPPPPLPIATSLSLPSSKTEQISDEHQLPAKSCDDHHQLCPDNDNYHKSGNNDRLLGFENFDNGNNITTPTETPETNASVELAPCPICSRTFNPVTLRKHVGICEKMATKKRNIFDSSRQRREGTDLASYPLPKNFGLPEKVNSSTSVTVAARSDRGQSPKPAVQQVSSPILSRKKPTEDLIRSTARTSMRKAAATSNATPTATAAPAPAVTTSTSSTNFTRDRMRSSERSLTRRGIQPPPAEQCPHCERCFGIKAYDRHVEWCKEKALQAAIKQGPSKNEGSVAKARLEARTKYRAPCLKTKRSINREKYSGLAGEEHENEENVAKCSKASGSNKLQDNSLMSMSMTSSMCSERIITHSTTGNINEPAPAPSTSAVESTAKHSIRSSSKGSHKCTRDRSQIRTQTPTRNKKLNATVTATATSPLTSSVAAAAAASSVDAYKEKSDAIINFEIEMPEFYLMGEQMTPNAINKKLIEKPTTTNTPKTKFDHLSTPKMKSKNKPKQSHLQENNIEQRLSDEQLEINAEFNRNLKIPTDIEIHFPEALTLICRNKKSPSDLSLKSSPPEICKTYETSNDNQVHNEVMVTKAKETAENLDLSTSIIFYNSQQNTTEKELPNKPPKKSKTNTKNNHKINDDSTTNIETSRSKKSKKEHPNNDSVTTNSIQSEDMSECMVADLQKLMVTREIEQFSNTSCDSFQTEFQLDDLIVKQSYAALNDGEISDANSYKDVKLTKSQTSFSKKGSSKLTAAEAAVEFVKPKKSKTMRKNSPSSFSILSTPEFTKYQEDKDNTPRNSPLNSAKTELQTSKTREKKPKNITLSMSRESVTESSVIEEEIIKSRILKGSRKKSATSFSQESTPESPIIKEESLMSRLSKKFPKEIARKKENTPQLLSSSEEESPPIKCAYEEQTRKNSPEDTLASGIVAEKSRLSKTVPKEHKRKTSTSTFTKENTSESTAFEEETKLCDNLCKESPRKNPTTSVSAESISDFTLIESLTTRKLKNKRNYSTLSLFEESTLKPIKYKEESLKSRLLRNCSKEKTRKSSSSSFYVESSVESTIIDADSMKSKMPESMVIEGISIKSKTPKSGTGKNSASLFSEENASQPPVNGEESVESGRRNTARQNSVYLSSKESTLESTSKLENSNTDSMKSDPKQNTNQNFASTFSNENTTDSTSVQKVPLKPKRLSKNRVSKYGENLVENLTNLEDISTEKEIFKDCLTDSDELRKVSSLESVEHMAAGTLQILDTKAVVETQIISDNEANILKNSLKSETFIRDLENNYEFEDQESNNKDQNDVLNSPKDLNIPEADNDNEAALNPDELKALTISNKKIKCIPNILKSLKLPRIPSPPPKLSRTIAPSIPNSLNQVEVNRLKTLNICQPKRKKLLRPTVSCTSALPLKAVPFSTDDSVDIYNVSSAPQMKTSKTTTNKEDTTVEKVYNNVPVMLDIDDQKIDIEEETAVMLDKEIKVIKEPPTQLKRNRSFTVRGLPDNYDPFLSAKRQLEELCSPMPDNVDTTTTTSHTPQMPSLPTTPSTNAMTTSLILSSSTPNTTPNLMSTSQIPQQTQKTPTLARSSSFRRTASLRGPRRSPLLAPRPPLFAQKHRPTIQRGLSDEGPISTNFLKPEEYDEMPVRSVCVNDFAMNKSPRVVRRDTSASNRKQPLKLNINAANAHSSSATVSPNIIETTQASPANTTSKYVSKTDSLAVFLKYEHELEKFNQTAGGNDLKKEITEDVKTSSSASTIVSTPLTNLDGPLNAKELKDKSNNLSKQNSAKNIKADFLEHNNSVETSADVKSQTENNDLETTKYGQVRLAPLATKPSTPLTKPSTPLTTNKPTTPQTQQQQQQTQPSICPVAMPLSQENQKAPKSPKPVALSSLFGSDNKTNTTKQTSLHSNSNLLYTEHQNSIGPDYIDPKLINKCDNLPINLNLKRIDFKHSDSDASERRMENFSSSSSESSAPPANSNNNKTTSLPHQTKFLPSVKQQQHIQQQQHQQQQQEQSNQSKQDIQQQRQNHTSTSVTNSQRNSAEGRNLLKRRIRLGRNQFLYDASPEGDSCSADDEGANRSSMECETIHQSILREHEKAFERLSSTQHQHLIDTPSFMPPLSAFDDFDFEEFLSSFENDDEQFPIFKDCREFLLNRSSKKQRSMLTTNSLAQNTNANNSSTSNNNSTNFKKSPSPQQTFPPLTPQTHCTTPQHFQFPTLPQHPKNQFNSFSHNIRTRNKYDEELSNAKSSDTFTLQSNADEYKEIESHQQKREIFISIETEQNDLDKSPISPNSIRNMVGNPQTVVEVEVDAAHDNKFSKISDDDTDNVQSICRSKNYPHHLEHLPNVQLNNAKNLRQMADEMSENLRLTMERRTAPVDVNMNSHAKMPATRHVMAKVSSNRSTGIPSGDAYADSDELSSLDGYPLSSPNSRLGVSSKTSADSAYGSLSRQRSSELTSQRSSSRSRPMASTTAHTVLSRPLAEESALARSRQLSASSSSSSEHNLPPISKSNSYHKQQQQQLQQQQQQQHLYNNSNNNNNNNSNNNNNNDLDDFMRYERNNNNNSYDMQSIHPTTNSSIAKSQSNLESLQQYNTSNSTMSTSMKMSRFCHECGSKFLLEQAKFCMDCGVKRLIL